MDGRDYLPFNISSLMVMNFLTMTDFRDVHNELRAESVRQGGLKLLFIDKTKNNFPIEEKHGLCTSCLRCTFQNIQSNLIYCINSQMI